MSENVAIRLVNYTLCTIKEEVRKNATVGERTY
jgi:hypothetical protein